MTCEEFNLSTNEMFSRRKLTLVKICLLAIVTVFIISSFWYYFRLYCQQQLTLDIIREQLLDPEKRASLAKSWFNIYKAINETLDRHGWRVFLHKESLLGWYRHNKSMIPWWKSIHFAISAQHFNPVEASIIADRVVERLKVLGAIRKIANRIYFREHAGGVEVELSFLEPEFSNLVWPLRKDTFEGYLVELPNEPALMLEKMFDLSTCQTLLKSETTTQQRSIPCWYVSERFGANFTNIGFWEDANRVPECEQGRRYNDPEVCLFRPRMTPEQKQMMINVLNVTLQLVSHFRDTDFFITGGSLIGFLRHQGHMIPWDDDVDISNFPLRRDNDFKYYADVVRRNIGRFPAFSFAPHENGRHIKIFGNSSFNSYAIAGHKWRWPFVDLDIWPASYGKDGQIEKFSYLSNVLPIKELQLLRRNVTFEGLTVNVPHDILKHLKTYFKITDINTCFSPSASHRFEQVYSSSLKVARRCSYVFEAFGYDNIS